LIPKKNILKLHIGEIASKDWRKADAFIQYGINFYSHGKQTLQNALKPLGKRAADLLAELELYKDSEVLPSRNMQYWNLDFLCNYIIETHHAYLKKAAIMLREYAANVQESQLKSKSGIKKIKKTVSEILEIMEIHMRKQEEVVFPAIIKLQEMFSHPKKINRQSTAADTVEKDCAKNDPDKNELWQKIEYLYTLLAELKTSENSDVAFQIYLAKINELNKDLILHMHLEQNILFPKALLLSAKFR
jgi:regulator of cell morphogenesis and NO signaling